LRYPQKINKIISKVLYDMKIETRLKNWQLIEKWEEIVGTRIAQHAQATNVDTENLFVEVDNPVWQSQLYLMKDKIIKKFKKYNVNIKDIKFKIMNKKEDSRRENERKN
jgi:predicted nucleic acid-binding Zn ribbon protein